MSSVLRLVRPLAIGLGATWLLAAFVLWLFQERLLFHPPGVGRDQLDAAAAEVGARPLDLVAADGTRLYAWHRSSGQGGRRLVLHFPGNAETVADNLALQRLLVTHGWDVLVGGYRGYPGSEGAPSEEGLALDAEAAWAWAVGPGGYPPERVVVHGRSLGGGVAARLVDGPANPAGLILESTFGSIREIASRRFSLFPVGLLLRHPFDTRERAPRLGVPVLLLHAEADTLIPADLGGRALRPVIAEVDYLEVGGGLGHDHCLPVSSPEAKAAYLSFLARFAGE